MKIKVAWIGKTKEPAIETLTAEYLKRISHYAEVAGLPVKDEDAILTLATGGARQKSNRDRHKLILLDSRGKQFSSEELAEFLDREQLNAIPLLFAIGGSDGFTEEARRGAKFYAFPRKDDAAARTRPRRAPRAAVPRFHHS
jgi:23S rRNA (pseudouridine1915-N3)-methyltransferase